MSELPQLSVQDCRTRQQRLRESLESMQVDRAILTASENVQWLTGFRPHRLTRAVAVLEVDGGCSLVAPGNEPSRHAADEVITYEAQWLCTLRQDQIAAALQKVPASAARSVTDFSMLPRGAAQDASVDPTILEQTIHRLRRKKCADELQMIRHAIKCTDAMYQRAREIVQPGITELQVFNALHTAAVEVAGEPLTDLGNDYQSNSPGGPPRPRAAEAGELMILDLGPAFRGYYADNCRTIAVNGEPTAIQLDAHRAVMSVFDLVRQFVRPGASCCELFELAKERLDEFRSEAFFHHLGHGIGLYPHEAPHLNPNWDDCFEEGDVFTVEPGLYTEELRAGIRIEENFLVTADGVEQLTSAATDL